MRPVLRKLCWGAFAAIGAALSVLATESTTTAGSDPSDPLWDSMEAGVPDLADRLRSLSPAQPMEYFRLAEELAYLSAVTPSQRRTGLRMAEQLYVLAYELDRASGSGLGLGPSVCLGLADIAAPTERDWLLALASSFGSGEGLHVEIGDPSSSTDDHARFDAAEALGRFRSVERRPLSATMRRIDVRQQMIHAGVDPKDADWAVHRLNRGLDRPYCPDCRNQRLVRTGTSEQSIEQSLCPTCFGNPEPDPPLSIDELRRMLAIEAKLLGASPRTWSALNEMGGWRPVVDLDPSGLAARYGVNPRQPYWVSESGTALIGEWSHGPAGAAGE